MPRQICADCHFFIKQARGIPDRPVLEVRQVERNQAKAADYTWHKDHFAIACDFGVWDQGHNFDAERQHELVSNTDRRGFCFFWKHRPGMLLPAARVLQRQQAEAADARRDRRLAILGLWIAAVALAIDVALRLAQRLSW